MELVEVGAQLAQAAEVILNPADRSLDCEVEGPWASTLTEEGFGYLWSGVRATHGITTGRYWFSVQIMEPLETTLTNIGDSADMYSDEDATANTIHCCRIGVSRLSTEVGTLGSVNSWGYGSTGKKSTGRMFSKYPSDHPDPGGRRFGPGDEVTCFVELSPSPSVTGQHSTSRSTCNSSYTYGTAGISFAVNGECLGLAFPLYQPADVGKALFPHVLVKNLRVLVRFQGERPLYWPKDKPWDGTWCGCLPWQACVRQSPGPVLGPSLRSCLDCHVIMMVGLPCELPTGKTANTWPTGSLAP